MAELFNFEAIVKVLEQHERNLHLIHETALSPQLKKQVKGLAAQTGLLQKRIEAYGKRMNRVL